MPDQIERLLALIGEPSDDPKSKKPKTLLAALDDLSYKMHKRNEILDDIAGSLATIACRGGR